MTNTRYWGAVSLLLAIAVAGGPHASAQETTQTRVSGTFNDYVCVEGASGGAGAWHVTGAWTAKVNAASGKGEFIASLLGVRSDLWVLLTQAEPANPALRSPHTHHVGLLDGDVSVIPNGIRLEGPAIITANGSVQPYSGSMVRVDITGGELVRFSNMRLTFLETAAVNHFGSQSYDGLVVLER